MNNNATAENKIFTLYCIALIIAIYCCGIVTSLFGSIGSLSFFDLGSLAIPAFALFLVVCILAIWKQKYYFIFLIFVILAFPAPIDDLFPSVHLTNPDDRRQVVFPLITRIDLYLILGILLKLLNKPFQFRAIKFPLSLKIFLLLFPLILVVNIFKSADLWDFNLLLAYSFHIRYLILFLILLQLYDVKKNQKQLLMGFVISLAFLLVEAYINTYMKGSSRLLSGSLSLNTFANIAAAIALYTVFLLKHKQMGIGLGLFTLFIALAIILGSGTRGAIITLILAYFSLYLLSNHRRIVINLVKVFGGIFLLGMLYFFASNKDYIPERYSYQEISKKINIDLSKGSLSKMINVKSSKETNSIKSRIDLFDSSLNMVAKNPFTGIGAGRWNRYKNTYSDNRSIPKVLLDTHNDYLALMSQYGILLGLFFAWLVFFYPFYHYNRREKKNESPLTYLFVINFAMGVAALSNAGFFKHQVAAVLLLCYCITIKIHLEEHYA